MYIWNFTPPPPWYTFPKSSTGDVWIINRLVQFDSLPVQLVVLPSFLVVVVMLQLLEKKATYDEINLACHQVKEKVYVMCYIRSCWTSAQYS